VKGNFMFGTKRADGDVLRCSFCHKAQHEVRKLIAGPTVFICDECVDVCNDIIKDDERMKAEAAATEQLGAAMADPNASGGRRLVTCAPNSTAIGCSMCRMPTPVDDLLPIEQRGVICPGCLGAIEAAAAASRRGGADAQAGADAGADGTTRS
jgi:hypothetical protein